MNMPEGNTLNVPELRRLLDDERQAREAYDTRFNELVDSDDLEALWTAGTEGEMERLAAAYGEAKRRLRSAAVKALPALLDVVEQSTRLIEDVQTLLTEPAATDEDIDEWMSRSNGFLAAREAGPS